MHEQFTIPICETCKTKRTHSTWTRLDMVSLAKKAGGVGRLIVWGYRLPTRQAHSTVTAMIERLNESERGTITFNEGPQYDKARDALFTAHALMLYILVLQKEHFNLESLESPLQKCRQDFQEIWINRLPGSWRHDAMNL